MCGEAISRGGIYSVHKQHSPGHSSGPIRRKTARRAELAAVLVLAIGAVIFFVANCCQNGIRQQQQQDFAAYAEAQSQTFQQGDVVHVDKSQDTLSYNGVQGASMGLGWSKGALEFRVTDASLYDNPTEAGCEDAVFRDPWSVYAQNPSRWGNMADTSDFLLVSVEVTNVDAIPISSADQDEGYFRIDDLQPRPWGELVLFSGTDQNAPETSPASYSLAQGETREFQVGWMVRKTDESSVSPDDLLLNVGCTDSGRMLIKLDVQDQRGDAQ